MNFFGTKLCYNIYLYITFVRQLIKAMFFKYTSLSFYLIHCSGARWRNSLLQDGMSSSYLFNNSAQASHELVIVQVQHRFVV